MTTLSDAYNMRDLAIKIWGKKDISLTNNPARQSKAVRGRCYKRFSKEDGEFFVIHLYTGANLKTIAHEIAHCYCWDNGIIHHEKTEELYRAYTGEKNPIV